MTTSLKRFLASLLIVLMQFIFISPQIVLAATAPNLGVAAGYSVFGNAGITETAAQASRLWGKAGDNGFLHANLIDSQVGVPPIDAAANVPVVGAISVANGDLSQPITGTIDLATSPTVVPGVYDVSVGNAFSSTLTLNGSGVYIFRSTSGIYQTAGGTMNLTNGACASNVFWQVQTDMTFAAAGNIEGTIIANTIISFVSGVNLKGRAWSGTQVTMDNNQITEPVCTTAPVDICANIEGVQTSLPDEYHFDNDGINCLKFELGGPPTQSEGTTTTTSTGQVLGATTLASTGSFNSNIGLALMIIGSTITICSFYVFKKRVV